MTPPRVLVVDDEEGILLTVVRQLRAAGVDSVTARTTEQALAAVRQGGIDAVLLDAVLGDENGWDVLRRITETGRVPVAMMSGGDMRDEGRQNALLMGAAAVLQKPFDAADLAACLKALGVPR